MNHKVRDYLIGLAKNRSLINYQELSDVCNLGLDMAKRSDRGKITKILEDIANHEFSENRPILSVIIIGKASNIPGKRFYSILSEIGVLKRNPDQKEKIMYFIDQVKAVHNYWATTTKTIYEN
ncbi:hypothetical protein GXP67_12550 [Rhodocytophaga rosea]|uniref:Uncharacterized protein n=1 Tax=Rhodocytophaga rosea TaxID=2704465 RepID=A0A6C0GHV7_9BACT|nr:hypothetical protein [Rhodocytophaga rosea]QHT67404.1 hypothetical protein GXP67_12550 [Rhodocytophaga rosea]